MIGLMALRYISRGMDLQELKTLTVADARAYVAKRTAAGI